MAADMNKIIDRLIQKKCSILIKIKDRNKKLFNFKCETQKLNQEDFKRGDVSRVKKRNKQVFIMKTQYYSLNKTAIWKATAIDSEIMKIVDKERDQRLRSRLDQ